MSHGWSSGSTRRWRQIRLQVLTRDRWICQLCDERIDPNLRHPHPRSAHVHHLDGKEYGDNPDRLAAAHRQCNLNAGDPTKTADPPPQPMTRW